jgi:excisionase family DNA binding protein
MLGGIPLVDGFCTPLRTPGKVETLHGMDEIDRGQPYLTISEAAQELGVGITSVQDWCRQGRFPHIKYAGKRLIRIPRAWLTAYASGEITEDSLEIQVVGRDGRIVKPAREKSHSA